MSELKTHKMVDEKYCADCVCVIPSEVYLKSEVDKEIAEKDIEIAEQKRLRDMALASVPNVLKVMKIIQYHKYKRCLAMARWCASRSASWCLDPADEQLHKSEFYDKWKHRWRKLAEKFKEAK